MSVHVPFMGFSAPSETAVVIELTFQAAISKSASVHKFRTLSSKLILAGVGHSQSQVKLPFVLPVKHAAATSEIVIVPSSSGEIS